MLQEDEQAALAKHHSTAAPAGDQIKQAQVPQQSRTVMVDKRDAAVADSAVSLTQTMEDRDLMAESHQDRDAILLEFNEPRIAVMGSREIKELEQTYFESVELGDTLLFGGTLGASPGGVTAFALSANGKLVA